MSCPPKQFLEDSTLENVKKCLTKKGNNSCILFVLHIEELSL